MNRTTLLEKPAVPVRDVSIHSRLHPSTDSVPADKNRVDPPLLKGRARIHPALSIMQPWPYAIFHLGKDFENRNWRLPPQYDGVPVLIHAGKKMDKAGLMYLKQEAGFAIPDEFQVGGIVGFAVFTIQCGEKRLSDWAEQGLYNWPIVEAGELPFYPCKGSLGFFRVSYPYIRFAQTIEEVKRTYSSNRHAAGRIT
jgi:hypothetical protein